MTATDQIKARSPYSRYPMFDIGFESYMQGGEPLTDLRFISAINLQAFHAGMECAQYICEAADRCKAEE